MRWIVLVAGLFVLSACGNVHHELAHTSKSDPVWPLNPARWAANENDLTTPKDAP
jgi:hypothetical protein